MKVEQAMHPGASWIHPQTPIADIARRMRQDDIGALPVGENDRLVGMVTDRDIVLRGLDAYVYAAYNGARFVVAGTPSGVTLAPEGGAHQSTITASVGASATVSPYRLAMPARTRRPPRLSMRCRDSPGAPI